MKGNLRTFLILLIIFVVLGIGVILTQPEDTEALITLEQTEEVATEPVVLNDLVFEDMPVISIQAIQLQFPANGQSLIVSRTADGTWTIPDSSSIINQDTASNMAASVALLNFERTISLPADNDLTQYGFASNQVDFVISVLLVDGSQHIVLIGDPLQTGPQFYALVDERPVIYLVDRRAVDYLASILENPPVTTP